MSVTWGYWLVVVLLLCIARYGFPVIMVTRQSMMRRDDDDDVEVIDKHYFIGTCHKDQVRVL